MTDNKIVVANSFRHLTPSQSLGEGISAGFNSIGIKGKTWTLKQSGEQPKFFTDERGNPYPSFDCVILAMNPSISKMYYGDEDYNEDSTGAPICTSLKGDKPDAGVAQPQSTACGICKNNEWGSAKQGRGKACQDHRKLAVLIMPYMTKHILEKPLLEPVYFKVPPGSLKALKAYGDSLVHRGVHYASVITSVSFVPGKLFEMKFELKQALTDAEAPVVLPLMEDPQTKNILGNTGRVYEEEAAPPAINKQPQDSGLLNAFGVTTPKPTNGGGDNAVVPIKRGRGRPPNNPKPAPVEKAQAAPPEEAQQELPMDETDDELDDAVSKVLGDKMGNMLK